MSERIVISPPERKMLESRARARSGSVAEAMRSKIVLSLTAGHSQAQTSRTVGCSVNTVRLWKERFLGERLGGLYGVIGNRVIQSVTQKPDIIEPFREDPHQYSFVPH